MPRRPIYVNAYRLAWRSRAMPAPSFWYYRDPEEAKAAQERLNRQGCQTDLAQTRVPITAPCMDGRP